MQSEIRNVSCSGSSCGLYLCFVYEIKIYNKQLNGKRTAENMVEFIPSSNIDSVLPINLFWTFWSLTKSYKKQFKALPKKLLTYDPAGVCGKAWFKPLQFIKTVRLYGEHYTDLTRYRSNKSRLSISHVPVCEKILKLWSISISVVVWIKVRLFKTFEGDVHFKRLRLYSSYGRWSAVCFWFYKVQQLLQIMKSCSKSWCDQTRKRLVDNRKSDEKCVTRKKTITRIGTVVLTSRLWHAFQWKGNNKSKHYKQLICGQNEMSPLSMP